MCPRPPRLLGIALLACALGSAGPVAASWPVEGLLGCTSCRARLPFITSDGSGGAYVLWTDERDLSITDEDIYLQRVTATGEIAPGWPANGVPVSTAPENQSPGHRYGFVPDGLGGVLIAWSDTRDLNVPGGTQADIYALRVLADGSLAPGWPQDGLAISRRPGYESSPVVLADGAGGGFMTWYDSTNPDVYLTRLTADGQVAPGWPAEGLPVCTLPSFQGAPRLASDGTGGVFIVWGDFRDGPLNQYVQRVTGSGEIAPAWPENGVRVMADCALRGGILADGAGGAYIGCATQGGIGDDDYYLQRFTAEGSIAPGWPAGGVPVCLAPEERSGLRMELDGTGGVLLVWTDERDFGDDDVFALRVRPDGTRYPGWPVDGLRVTDNTSAFDNEVDLAPDGLGGAYLCWDRVSGPLASDGQILVQHLMGDGSRFPGWPANGRALPTVAASSRPHIVSDGAGGAIVVWEEYPAEKVRALRIAPDGPVPVLVSLVSVEAEPGLVRLTGYVADGVSLIAAVERRTETSAWERLGHVTPDGTGRLSYEDRAVAAGTRYGYRLGVGEGATIVYTSESWVTVPALRFALRGLTPNPSAGDPVVAFTLASDEPAALELYDLGGRMVQRHPLGSPGPGAHAVRLGTAGRLAAGVYTVRLRQGAKVATVRAVIIR